MVEPGASSGPGARAPLRPATIVCALVLFAVVAVRLHRLDVPLERDEGEYGYVAQLVLQGVAPFAEAHNMKMPGIYWAYAGALAAFGADARGVRLGLLAANLTACALVFALGRRLLAPGGAALAAAAFALLSLLPAVLGLFGHATQFLLVPALAGLRLLLAALERGRLRLFLASGLLLGLAFTVKQHGAAFSVFGGMLLVDGMARSGAPASRTALALVTLAAGALLPFLAICLYLSAVGAFDTFWFWTFEYASRYVAITPPGEVLPRLAAGALPLLLGGGLPLLVLAGVGAGDVARRGEGLSRDALLGLPVLSFLATAPGFYFRPHYFVLLLPALSLLAAAGLLAAGRRLGNSPARQRTIAALLLGAAVFAFAVHSGYLVTDDDAQVSRRVYPEEFFPETRTLSRALRERSGPDDSIAVLGSEPQVYFYAERHAATGFLYTYPLMEPQDFARRMQQQMIREIEARDPRFLVVFELASSWERRPDSHTDVLRWLERAARRYRLVGLVELRQGGRSQFFWDGAVRRARARSGDRALVYERAADPDA